MLGSSVQATGRTLDYRAITDRAVDPLLVGGAELLDYVDATLTGAKAEVAAARDGVITTLGWEATVDAAGVMGNFEMMNRIADATGMPVGVGSRRANAQIIEDLGLAEFDHVASD